MRLRLLMALVVFAAMPGAMAHGRHVPVDSRVHDRGICWEPDVEFPVPCDDDDD
jgi:hypothetical protein